MEKYFLIKTHRGKKKPYYTLRLIGDGHNLGIYGRFGSLKKAKDKAETLMRRHMCGLVVR